MQCIHYNVIIHKKFAVFACSWSNWSKIRRPGRLFWNMLAVVPVIVWWPARVIPASHPKISWDWFRFPCITDREVEQIIDTWKMYQLVYPSSIKVIFAIQHMDNIWTKCLWTPVHYIHMWAFLKIWKHTKGVYAVALQFLVTWTKNSRFSFMTMRLCTKWAPRLKWENPECWL